MPRATRIAIVLHDLSGGGTERIALRLAQGWKVLRREVVLLCGDPTGPLAPLAEGIEIVSPPQPIARGWGSRRRLGRWVAEEVATGAIDGLFLPGNYHFPLLTMLAPLGAKRPRIVAKLSNSIDRQRRYDRFRPFWQPRMARRLARADAVVAMSPNLAEEARRVLGDLPLHVVPEPILDDDVVPPPSDLPRRGIAAAGRFAPQKNFGLLLDALAPIDDPAATLTIAGDGPERALLLRVAEQDLPGRVSLPGRLDDIAPLLRSSRLFVLSSRFEGYPAVLVEALANGCRLVATDCSPAVREIVRDPSIGEVVPPGDPIALAQAVRRQLGFAPPPTTAMTAIIAEHRLGRSAARFLELFD